MNRIRSLVFTPVFALLLAAGWAAPTAAAPKPNTLGPDLFLAVSARDAAAVRDLLGRGADPNARNFLEMTPLMLAVASRQPEIAGILLDGGSDRDATGVLGGTLTFAGLGGDPKCVQLLLDRGANPDPRRPDGLTLLMLEARSGHTEILPLLLAKKPKVDARDNGGLTALTYAAREGQLEAVRILVAAGATVDIPDNEGWTALMHAAAGGGTEVVTYLLGKGANANARDRSGRTALLIASSYGDTPGVVRALIAAGANPQAKDGANRTPLALALARGHAQSAAALRGSPGSGPAGLPAASERTPRAAAQAGLALVQKSVKAFAERTGCVSCHHQGTALMALGLARDKGMEIDAALLRTQVERIAGGLAQERPLVQKALADPAETKHLPGIEIGELPPGSGFILSGLAAVRQPGSEVLSGEALILARQQAADGHWHFGFVRAPMQSSLFAITALAARAVRAYAPADAAAEVAGRMRRARDWLASQPAVNSEDRAWRLLGLKWTGGTEEQLRSAVEAIRADQRPDGGWAQLPGMKSDAYASGEALYVLQEAGGVAAADPAIRRGVQFLLRTQDEDGSWFVSKRAIPANNYFDADFPHGESQYISLVATCWASMALLLAG